MLGSMLWGMLTSASEWAFRAPVLLERVDLAGRGPFASGVSFHEEYFFSKTKN